MLRLLSVVLGVVICSMHVAAQVTDTCGYTLSGQVIDDHDGQPLEFATVLIVESGQGTVADSFGNFVIRDVCKGNYTIRFSHVGCETLEDKVRLQKDMSLNLRLEHHAEVLNEILLTAKRVARAGSVAQEALDSKALEVSQGQALGEVMKSLPGVNAIQTGPAIFKPVIHGLHSNRVLIINNGIRQEGQQWGIDHAPEIDPFLASSVTVVKGTAAVQYGSDAVAGVILVEQELLPVDKPLAGRAGTYIMSNGWQFGTSALLENGLGKGFGFRWHGTLKAGGDKHAPDYQLTNTGVREANTSLAFGYRRGLTRFNISYSLFNTEIAILRSAHIGNLTDLREALQRGEPFVIEPFSYAINNPRQSVQHQVIKVDGQRFIANAGLLSGYYAIQLNRRKEFDIRRGDRDDKPALDLRLTTQVGELRFAHESILDLRGNVALHWNWQQNTNIPGTGVIPLIPNYSSYNPAVSIVEKWVNGRLEMEGGLRYEYEFLRVNRLDSQNKPLVSDFKFHNYSSSVGAHYNLNTAIAIKGNIGSTRRAPNVNELFSSGLHHGVAAIEEGDSTLMPEKAVKFVFGLELSKSRVQGEFTVYFQSIRDFIYLRPEGEPRLTIRGAFPVFKYVQTDARLWGTDLAMRFNIVRNFDLESRYSIVRGYDTVEDQPLIFMPADRMSHKLLWQSSAERWEAGLGFDYVWEQIRVPAGLDYAQPPSAYALLNVSAGSHFTVGRNEMDIYLTVSNLLNARFREYLNRLRYFADDVGRNIELRLLYKF